MNAKVKMKEIIEALGVTVEVLGQQVSPAGLLLMADDLVPYGVPAVLAALIKVRRECRRLALADVIDRIQTADGRPGADEAWANAQSAFDESETVVWTAEAALAFAIARPLLEINDKTGARMAFRDAYDRLCRVARDQGERASWVVSLGLDVERRRVVLEAAVTCDRLSADRAQGLLPPAQMNREQAGNVLLALVSRDGLLLAQAASLSGRARIDDIKAMLAGGGGA